MAVRIRLKRTGRRNRPFYRICVFDSRTRRDGKPVEELGHYDPRGADWGQKVTLDRKRAHHWIMVGALPTETVASIFRRFLVFKDRPFSEEGPAFAAAPTTEAGSAPEAAAPEAAVAESATATATAEPATEAAPEVAAESSGDEAADESGDRTES